MSRGQRLSFLAIAVVIAIVAIVVLADTSEDDGAPSQTAATATPTATAEPGEETPTATPTPTPTPKPPPPVLSSGEVTRLNFTEGETVRFRVRADAADHVHVHGYDLMRDVEPGKTVTMSFKATITGIFEIEFEDAGEEIGRLRVDPK